MTLYLYRIGTSTPILTLEQVESYTADSVTTQDGTVYAPLAEDCELSSKIDCSETLREQHRKLYPSNQDRLNELENILATILYGE